MPQGEIWKPTRRDTLRAEAFSQTPYGKQFNQEMLDLGMQAVANRIANGTYTPTEQDLIDLEEWRKNKARRDAEAENAAEIPN